MQRIFLFLLSLLSYPTFAANQCDLKGNNYFEIQFNIVADNNKYQEVYVTNNGRKRTETLWYTGSEKQDNRTPYLFNEQDLEQGVEYQVKIINDNVNYLVRYYLRRYVSGGGEWSFVEQLNEKIHQGKINILSNDNDMDLICDESQVEPENPIPFDQCEYFPQPVQSWITEGTSDYSTFPESVLDVRNSTEIKGWSANYLADSRNIYRYTQNWQGGSSWDTLRVGFDQVSDPYFAYENANSKLCNGTMGCYPGNDDGNINLRKVSPPTPISVAYTATYDLKVTPSNYQTICDGEWCSLVNDTDEIIIQINKDLNSLDVQDGNFGKNVKIIFSGNRVINSVHIDDEVSLYLDKNLTITFDLVKFDGSVGHVIFESATRLNVTGVFNSELILLDFTYVENADDFIFPMIYGPNATLNIKSQTGSSLKAFILGKVVQFDNLTTVEGSVTANKLIVASGLTLIPLKGSPDCWDGGSVDNDYALTLQPAEAYSLICAAQRLEFQVVDNNNQATGDFTGTISVSPASARLALVQGKGSGSNGSYTANANGELWFDLSASASQTVTITGTLNPQGDSDSVSGTYHFVPYKLAADDQYVIANKPQTIELKALACNDNGGVVDINYAGTPTIQSNWVAPTSGVGSLTFAPSFTQGVASSELTMEDSGIQTVTMTDKDFDCSGLTDCPVEGAGTLQGSFTVYSRPWTFAICSPDNNAMDGNITDAASKKFTAAGNTFALNIRPLRWVDGVNDNSSPQAGGSAIETSAYCSSAVTQNFFSDQSQLAALVVLSHQVAQPDHGNDGTFNGTLEQLNTTGGNSEYLPFSELSWSEVGVLRVNADISGTYLDMKVNQGYREIGRFSPDHLALISNDWDYADGHSGFVYMNQTIPYRFTVEAQNMQSDATTNYSAFSQALIADVKLLAVDSDGEELSDRIDEYDLQLWDGAGDGAWSGATLSVTNDFTFLKQQQSASPYTTSVDGPYQSGFGLRVSDKVDGVDFVSPDLELKASTTLLDTGKRFTTQPDIRYGRMVLGDVGGTSVSTINVPLRVEYWQGSRFAINADDSGSYFATPNEYVCKQTVWPTSGSGSSSKLTGSDTPSSWAKVASGKSSVVFATPASSDETADVREQVRFWLRLDDDARSSPQLSESGVNCGAQYTSQPWLQYNWRDKGDEDPSAVVTFGIHRGNDKVIFRGETRLTGQ